MARLAASNRRGPVRRRHRRRSPPHSDPQLPQTTVAGTVVYLTILENHWLVRSFLGDLDTPTPGTIRDPSLASVLNTYQEQCARSRTITDTHTLDTLEQPDPFPLLPDRERPPLSLRWILWHLIQDTARRIGQLDTLRQLLNTPLPSREE